LQGDEETATNNQATLGDSTELLIEEDRERWRQHVSPMHHGCEMTQGRGQRIKRTLC